MRCRPTPRAGPPVKSRDGEALQGRSRPRLDDLVGGVWDALWIRPPAWGMSVFGSPSSWLPARYSEYGLLQSWRVVRAARYVADVSIPSMPVTAPAWFPEPLAPFFWNPSRVAQHPDHHESWTSHPHEAWLFVNGILTNDSIGQLNAAYLADLFHRPITLIENSTDGLVEDLVECAREKSFGSVAEATEKAFPAIYDALKDPEKRRVVVIAHSQGTIIAAAVLRLMGLIYRGGRRGPAVRSDPKQAREAVRDAGVGLDPTDFGPIDRDELGKLELYCFANCATHMEYLDRTPRRPPPLDRELRQRVRHRRPPRHARSTSTRAGRGHRRTPLRAQGCVGSPPQPALPTRDRQEPAEGHKGGPRDTSAAPYVLINGSDYPDVSQPRLYRYLNGGSPLTDGGSPLTDGSSQLTAHEVPAAPRGDLAGRRPRRPRQVTRAR